MASRPITTLPVASRSILRSTTILTSLPQVVFELVQNSLDAEASHVDVGVDVEAWQCWVRDDGHGLEQTGLSILAKGNEDLEGRYGTSKAHDPVSLGNVSTFGFRGEALASAADLSCLEISSRTRASRETWSVILKGGKKLYYGPAVRWRREKPGTTVCIRDAFYNLPIRRRSHPNPARTLELIRKDLECVALVFPNVTFSLENTAKERNEGGGRGRIMTIPKTFSSLSAFRHLFGRALCEHVDEIDVCMNDMRIQGFLSLEGAQSKAYQYLYVNRHPLSPCNLHRTIDGRFASSSFGKHAFDEAGQTKSPRPTTRRSPRKNERRPVYMLNITAPPRSVDNCLEPAKTAVHFENPDAVSNFLSTVVQSFLVRHGFSSAKSKKSSRTSSGSPSHRKRRRVAPGSAESETQSRPSASTAASEQGTQHLRPSANSRQQPQESVLSADPSADSDQELKWVDPLTGQVYMVDPKTGNSYPANARLEEDDEHGIPDDGNANHGGRRSLVDTSRLRKRWDPQCAGEALPDWMQEALEGWQNPTFGLQEPGVSSMTSVSSSSRRPWLQSHSEPGSQSGKRGHFFDANLTVGQKHNADDASTSFDRAQLKRAEVVGQVDRKFVACLVDDGSEEHLTGSRTLILVDQHAADERVRVEQFLSELCRGFLDHSRGTGVETWEVKPAVPVLLTREEARALAGSQAYRHAFERWGFRFAPIAVAAEEDRGGDDYLQVLVEAVPEVVSEKLLAADELGELIKGFLARLEVDGAAYSASPSDSRSSEHHWTTALRWCPRELLDLVNSKACRGAIMFNDSLDMDQCQRLMWQLSETVWPFMCAHGRPSLVPLTDVELGGRIRRDVEWHSLGM